ncbi:MAG: ferrochelatase [Cellulomonadaceae bacterium]|jgi:ferrochelatase|nr:ferrochelatase [Cellulomonadaceae bacterium]
MSETTAPSDAGAFDALIVLGFGGPEGPDEVWPFLERVTAGKRIPRERLADVAEHYLAFGGVSPVNAQTWALAAGLAARLQARGMEIPVVVANRNSAPFIPDVLAELAAQGAQTVAAVTLTPFASYSSCLQYREDIAAGLIASGLTGGLDDESGDGLRVVKLPPYADLAGLEQAWVEEVQRSMAADPGDRTQCTTVLFTTHSIPLTMNDASGPKGGAYLQQHRALAERIMARVGDVPWELVFQSRSGPPHIPWLEPDIADALRSAKEADYQRVIVAPIGFLTDHMEVVWDLDTEAAEVAADVGLAYTRAATPGTTAAFQDSWADWVADCLATAPGAAPSGENCSGTCCEVPKRDSAIPAAQAASTQNDGGASHGQRAQVGQAAGYHPPTQNDGGKGAVSA